MWYRRAEMLVGLLPVQRQDNLHLLQPYCSQIASSQSKASRHRSRPLVRNSCAAPMSIRAPLPRSQVCRSSDEVLDVFRQGRDALLAKGWTLTPPDASATA